MKYYVLSRVSSASTLCKRVLVCSCTSLCLPNALKCAVRIKSTKKEREKMWVQACVLNTQHACDKRAEVICDDLQVARVAEETAICMWVFTHDHDKIHYVHDALAS